MRAPAALALLLLALAACRPAEEPPEEPRLDLVAARFADLPGWRADDPRPALAAFLRSCAAWRRQPAERALAGAVPAGRIADWLPLCAGAERVAQADAAGARAFLEAHFLPYAASNRGEAGGLFTGYYEPLLQGAREPRPPFLVPLHRRPDDLVSVDLGLFDQALAGRRIAGRVEDGRLRPYPSRAEIDQGALDGRGLELLWVDDQVDKFFLQIQGSGQVALEDGARLRVGYADQNGHVYRAIGRDLVEMGELAAEAVSLQTIRAWLRANPERAGQVMARNASYVFFRELDPDAGETGPLGAQGVPLTAERSLAVDHRFVPYGLPVWLEVSAPFPEGERPFRRLMVAQDTGGAIRGPVRGDVFWGTGERAEHVAGHMRHRGRYWLLLPRALAPAS